MEIRKVDEKAWHKLSSLDSFRQCLLSDVPKIRDYWGMEHIEIVIDTRTGRFFIRDGTNKDPAYLKIEGK